MVDPITAWRTEHEYFTRLLNLLRAQVDRFHQGEDPDYGLMMDIVTYLRDYGDEFHHPREDVAFARLAQYCPDIELVLARLQQEHRVIAHAGDQLLGQIQAVLGGAVVERAQIEATAATYLTYYENHLFTEDEAVLSRAARYLSADDWEAVRTCVPLGRDPVFGTDPQERFRQLRRQLATETP